MADKNSRPSAAGVLLLEPGEKSPEGYLQRDFTITELSENFRAKQASQELLHKVLGMMAGGGRPRQQEYGSVGSRADRLPGPAGPRP